MKERLFLVRILPIAFLVIFIAMITQIATCSFSTVRATSKPIEGHLNQPSNRFWTLKQLRELEKEDILYVNTFVNSSKIYLTGGGWIEYNGSMTDLYDKVLREKRLPKISQSYAVNDSISCYTFTKNLRSEKKYTVHINGKNLRVSKEYNGLVDFLIKPCQ